MEKNMSENFSKLERRVIDSLESSDLEQINYFLNKINCSTLVSGVGGSSVVSEFASKVLSDKNHIITRNSEPRDFRYMNLELFKNILICSYGGNNFGVDLGLDNNLNHYLLSSRKNNKDNIINLAYSCSDVEKSFISLGATLIPCSILLNYYLDGDINRVMECFSTYEFNFDVNCDNYEIFSGYETSTASKFLESTICEAGIGVAIIHDKYSYCHGRSTLSTIYNNIAIYFNGGTELDKIMLEELPKYYKDVVVIDFNDSLVDEYKLLIKCMFLCKYIAEEKSKDLSGVDYSPIAKKLYYYKGNL